MSMQGALPPGQVKRSASAASTTRSGEASAEPADPA